MASQPPCCDISSSSYAVYGMSQALDSQFSDHSAHGELKRALQVSVCDRMCLLNGFESSCAWLRDQQVPCHHGCTAATPRRGQCLQSLCESTKHKYSWSLLSFRPATSRISYALRFWSYSSQRASTQARCEEVKLRLRSATVLSSGLRTSAYE